MVAPAIGSRGRRLDARGFLTTYAYNAGNQLTSRVDGTGTTTTTYDPTGNTLLEVAPANARTTYAWDFENRLTSVVLPSGVRNTMAYDPDNLRIRLDETAGTAKFRWDQQNVVAETDATNTLACSYSLIPETYGQIVSQRRGATSSHLHFDGQESNRRTSSSAGAAINTLAYKAFGELVFPNAPPVGVSNLFVGKYGYQRSASMPIDYARARHVNFLIGRWLSGKRSSRTFNYAYARNVPTGVIEPSASGSYDILTPGSITVSIAALQGAVPEWDVCGKGHSNFTTITTWNPPTARLVVAQKMCVTSVAKECHGPNDFGNSYEQHICCFVEIHDSRDPGIGYPVKDQLQYRFWPNSENATECSQFRCGFTLWSSDIRVYSPAVWDGIIQPIIEATGGTTTKPICWFHGSISPSIPYSIFNIHRLLWWFLVPPVGRGGAAAFTIFDCCGPKTSSTYYYSFPPFSAKKWSKAATPDRCCTC